MTRPSDCYAVVVVEVVVWPYIDYSRGSLACKEVVVHAATAADAATATALCIIHTAIAEWEQQ